MKARDFVMRHGTGLVAENGGALFVMKNGQAAHRHKGRVAHAQLFCGTALLCLTLGGVHNRAGAADGITADNTGSPVDVSRAEAQPGKGFIINNDSANSLSLDDKALSDSGMTDDESAALRKTGNGDATLTSTIKRQSFDENSPYNGKVDRAAEHLVPDPSKPQSTPNGTISIEQGSLTVDRGGELQTNGFVTIGRGDTSNGGTASNGTMNVTNGGKVETQPVYGNKPYHRYSSTIIGYGPGANGRLTVTGDSSSYSVGADNSSNGQIAVGEAGGNGTVVVGDSDGGSLQAGRLVIGGADTASTGTVTVSGKGQVTIGPSSRPDVNSAVLVGGEGKGTLNIGDVEGQNQSSVTINGKLVFGNEKDNSGSGTLNLNKGGTLSVGDMNYDGHHTGRDGDGIISNTSADNTHFNFNGGTLKNRDEGGLLSDHVAATLSDGTTTTVDTNAGTVRIYGDLSGTGSLTVGDGTGTGKGSLILTGQNTYTGDTNIKSATLVYGDGSDKGKNTSDGTISHTREFYNDGTLVIDHSDDVKVTQNISGTGSLVQQGSGKTILSGQNYYTGDTSIKQGTLILGNASHNGRILESSVIHDDGVLVVDHSDDVGLQSDIDGTGSFTKGNNNILTLTGKNSFTGDTTIEGGTLVYGDGSNAGTNADGSLTKSSIIHNNGTLVVNHSDDVGIGSAIDGPGSMIKNGGNTLTLTGQNTYTGDTTIQGGGLTYGDGSNAGTNSDGSLTKTRNIVLNNGGVLRVNHSDNVSLGSKVAGNGAFVQSGSGTTTLNGTIDLNGAQAGQTLSEDTKTPVPVSTVAVDNGTLVVDGSSGNRLGTSEAGGNITIRTDGYVAVGRTNGDNGTLNIINGGGVEAVPVFGAGDQQRSSVVLIGHGPGSTGTVNVSGKNSSLVANGPQGLIAVGNKGTGTLNVTDSAYTRGDQVVAGIGKDSNGTITVSNNGFLAAGSDRPNNKSGLIVNDGGTGTVNVSDGGKIIVRGQMVFDAAGKNSGKGTFNLGKGGMLQAANIYYNRDGKTYVADGIATNGSNYEFNLNGGTLQVAQGGQLTSTLNMNVRGESPSHIDTNQGKIGLSGDLSGSGGLEVEDSSGKGTGVLTLTGHNTYTGDTGIRNATLVYGDGTNAGTNADGSVTKSANIHDDGALVVNHADNVNMASNIDGSGTLTKMGNNTLTLTGKNTYTGNTSVRGGRLVYGNGTNAGTNDDGSLTKSENIRLDNGAILSVNHSDNVSLGSKVAGNGAFVKSGSGTTTLNGTLDLSGATANTVLPEDTKDPTPVGTVAIDSGTLIVDGSSGSSLGESEAGGKINIRTDGYVAVGRTNGDNGTLNITNGGGVEAVPVAGAGDQQRSGVVLIGHGPGSTGTVNVSGKNSSLVANGPQGLIVVGNKGTGTLNVTDSAYTRGDQVVAGAFGKDSNGTINVSNHGFLAAGSDSPNSGSGLIVNNEGNGTVNISNGGKVVVNGQMVFDAAGQNSGNGTLNLNEGGTLQAADVTYQDKDSKTQVLNGISTGGRNYNINLNGGTLQVAQGGQLTSTLDMNVQGNNPSHIDTNQGRIALSGELSGRGDLEVDDSSGKGSGRLILTGDNSYKGQTIVQDGTLQIGDNSKGGTATLGKTSAVHLVNKDSTLDMNNGAGVTSTIGMPVDGDGSFVQNGDGTTIMTGQNSYTGTTTVNHGTLQIDGDQSKATGATTVNSDGILRGTGTIGGDVAISGGTLAAYDIGSSPVGSKLRINGNLDMRADASNKASALNVRLGANGAADRVVVQKTASLGAGTKLLINPDANADIGSGDTYRIMTAGQRIRANPNQLDPNFSGVGSKNRYYGVGVYIDPDPKDSDLPAGTDNTAQALDIRMMRNNVSFGDGGFTRNGASVGYALDHNSGLLSKDAPYMDDSSQSGSGESGGTTANMSARAHAQRQAAYDALSGEINASIRTALFEDTFYIRQAVLDRMSATECDGIPSGQESSTPGQPHTYRLTGDRCSGSSKGVWGQAYGGIGRNDSDGNAAALHRNTAGFIAGYDHTIGSTEHLRLGGVVGYSHSGFNVRDGRDSSGQSENVTAGLYAGTHLGPLHLRTGADYTFNVVNTSRRVNYTVFNTNGTIADTRSWHQHNHYLGGVVQAYAELALRFHIGRHTRFEPFVNGTYLNQHNNASTESGGPAALHIGRSDNSVEMMTAGIRASTKFNIGQMVLEPYGSAAYRHTFGNLTPALHESFADGGGEMEIAGAPLSETTALLDAGVRAWLSDVVDVSLAYVGQYGNHSHESGARANVRVRF